MLFQNRIGNKNASCQLEKTSIDIPFWGNIVFKLITKKNVQAKVTFDGYKHFSKKFQQISRLIYEYILCWIL